VLFQPYDTGNKGASDSDERKPEDIIYADIVVDAIGVD
jgi:hypothetical protein